MTTTVLMVLGLMLLTGSSLMGTAESFRRRASGSRFEHELRNGAHQRHLASARHCSHPRAVVPDERKEVA